MNMTQIKDFYELLGVSETATNDEIRKAYRKLAHQYHPDKTGGDVVAEEKLKEINVAYDVLKNKEKRSKYDQQRKFGDANGDFYGFNTAGFDFSDIVGSAFRGGASGHRTKRTGRDLEATVSVSLRELAEGTSKRISLRRNERCEVCAGTGGKPGTSPLTCSDCGGTGVISQGNGFFSINRTCPACHGDGQRYLESCALCHGNGVQKNTREISLRVPMGVNVGARLRIAGEGEPGDLGAANGDLYVRIELEPDPFFKLDGKNLVCEVPISLVEAALGGSIRVPTIKGVADVTVKPGTQTGAQLRMTGMGLPAQVGGRVGDQIVRLTVEVPKKLSPEQKKLLRQFDKDYVPQAHPLKDAFKRLLARFRP